MQQYQKAISIIGCLLGTAIRDAFGLPYEGLSKHCQQDIKQSSLPLPIYGVLLRNLLFFVVVIFHGFRRLFPPY